jgi:hypothetical protein
MRHIGYESCRVDPDLWMMARPRDDHFEYYSYVLVYVDDILVISHEVLADLRKIDHYFKMKKDSVGDPDIYLGSKLRKVVLSNGVHAWMISPNIREAITNMERHLERVYGFKFPKRV